MHVFVCVSTFTLTASGVLLPQHEGLPELDCALRRRRRPRVRAPLELGYQLGDHHLQLGAVERQRNLKVEAYLDSETDRHTCIYAYAYAYIDRYRSPTSISGCGRSWSMAKLTPRASKRGIHSTGGGGR